jgi:hypothetical protein
MRRRELWASCSGGGRLEKLGNRGGASGGGPTMEEGEVGPPSSLRAAEETQPADQGRLFGYRPRGVRADVRETRRGTRGRQAVEERPANKAGDGASTGAS